MFLLGPYNTNAITFSGLKPQAVSSSPCQQKLVEERLFGIQGELQTVLRISETFACKYVLETKSRNSHQETLSDISGRNMSIIFKKYLW